MSALRPGAWAPHPHIRSPSPTAVRGHSMAERCASRRKRRPRKPVPRPVGWHLGGVGLAQADQVGGDGALRAVPGVGAVRTSGRWGADRLVHTSGSYYGGGQRVWPLKRLTCTDAKMASPHLIAPVISSKALLYRCAVSRAGCYGRGDCRRRPTTPWSSKCAGQVYVVGAGGVEPPTSCLVPVDVFGFGSG